MEDDELDEDAHFQLSGTFDNVAVPVRMLLTNEESSPG